MLTSDWEEAQKLDYKMENINKEKRRNGVHKKKMYIDLK